MRATGSSARALGGALVLALLAAASLGAGLPVSGDAAPSPEQAAAVKDSFDWAEGIISALAELAPPLAPAPIPAPRPRRFRRGRHPLVLLRRHPVPALPVFVGRHLALHRSTVFGIFDLAVRETSPRSFDLIVGSDEPAENICVRDQKTRAVLVDRSLDDERVFRVTVPGGLSPDLVVEVSLSQAGGIDKAYFPLLGDAWK